MDDLLLSTLRLSLPLLFAAYGGMLSERSGVANIALEAYLLFAAFTAAAMTALCGSLWIGAASGIAAAALVGFLFGFVCLWGRGDQIVIGTGFNLLAAGSIPLATKTLFGVTGSTPQLSLELRFTHPWGFVIVAAVCVAAYVYLFRSTRHGLRILAAGDNPQALVTQGVSARVVRLRAIVEGSAIAGIGGVYLSLCQGSGYIRDMSAGRGFIALAALIFGAWKPVPTMLACLFFALADAVQIQLQGRTWNGIAVPNQFVQIVPYVATLLVLVIFARRIRAPEAINRE